jgi:ribosomal protein L15
MKLKKRKKSGRMHGRGMGSHGWGSRKKHVGTSGHSGGKGMSGTGKMAGHKKTLVLKLYGNNYFGKSGITSRKTEKRKNHVLNLGYIENNLENLKKKFGKKEKGEEILDLSEYKILGDGELKSKVFIIAKSASLSAIEKIKKIGAKLILNETKEEVEKLE